MHIIHMCHDQILDYVATGDGHSTIPRDSEDGRRIPYGWWMTMAFPYAMS